MAKYRIEFDREGCIGAFACYSLKPDVWEMAGDGKVNLVGGTYNEQTKRWEKIIEEKDLTDNKYAADACPVNVIRITRVEE